MTDEFFTHKVEQPYDWTEWVCPDPKGYLMKCCDCGLVHEAEFGVVRYKSETEREDCDFVDDPNLQAVFRMRRSEQWSPVDTAHRAGGLPMEQSEQEAVAGCACRWNDEGDRVVTCERHEGWLEVIAEWADRARDAEKKLKALSAPPPAQRQRFVFPTMLRKMWSGSEVQAWLDKNVNKENK